MTELYIVTWIVSRFVIKPCAYNNDLNEYGIDSRFTCDMVHGKHQHETMKKEFATLQEAQVFVGGAPVKHEFGMKDYVSDFGIRKVEESPEGQ